MADWTLERIEELKQRWAANESCRTIGAAMRVTRSAVIGKIHRLGLSGRKAVMSPEERERKKQERNGSRIVRQRIERNSHRGEAPLGTPAALPPFIGALNIPFGDLRSYSNCEPNQCRYIASEPAGPDYPACGNETLSGESWCGYCKDIVFNRGLAISETDRLRRASHAKKIGRNPQIIRTAPDVPTIEDEAA